MVRREASRFHGFLIIDKPAGLTSHDVVSRIRKLTRQRSVGHAGTLDPAATGVLPIALGDATKVLNVAADSSKTYLAEITFGVETDTYDADGQVVNVRDPGHLTEEILLESLDAFRGTIRQQVPRFSAVQRMGRRLYDMAREGVDFDPPWREVVIHDLQLIAFSAPVLTLCVDCGAGTYIRSLAHDLGLTLGAGAHLSNLVRLRSGMFTLEDAWTLDDVARIPLDVEWPSVALHPDSAFLQAPTIILDAEHRSRWEVGRSIPMSQRAETSSVVRAYSDTGHWIGYGVPASEQDSGVIQPRRVIGQDTASSSRFHFSDLPAKASES